MTREISSAASEPGDPTDPKSDHARRHGACVVCGRRDATHLYHPHAGAIRCEHCLLRERKQLAGLLDSHPYEEFAESLTATLDLREQSTGLHSKRVAVHTLVLARHHYADVDVLREIYWGSLLHDIGKIGVPDAILLKPGPLNDEEHSIMQRHPANGAAILANLPFFALAAEIVLSHEERYDGTGYPRALQGSAIPLAARLFAVIDTLDAMTFDRPYRKALPFDDAVREIARMSGSQFDPLAVETFMHEQDRLREMTALDHLLGATR